MLACPVHHKPLVHVGDDLQCPEGHAYPIVRGIPRFAAGDPSVKSFGDQWNFFNWTAFKRQWLENYV